MWRDEERRGQDLCLVADGDLAFLHGLEQRTLYLGGTVDFVGQKQVREDWAEVRGEFIGPLIEHLRTEDVRGNRSMVNCTRLNLRSIVLEIVCTSSVLAKPGMPAVTSGLREKCNQQPFDDHVLPHHDSATRWRTSDTRFYESFPWDIGQAAE